MSYFSDCHTPEELHVKYRQLCKQLHPDKESGDKVLFQNMQNEYEQRKVNIIFSESINTMPKLFDEKGMYEYFRCKVKYAGVLYNHYYKFVQDYGSDILIDAEHINLIFAKRNMI